jgi:hypothetical protein
MQQSFLGPSSLFILAVAAGAVAALLLLWVLGRALWGLVDRPRVPRPGTTYAAFLVLVALLVTVGALFYGLRGLYLDHANIGGPTRLGELRCEALAGGKVRTTFTPLVTGMAPGSVEEAASSCRIELDLIRMRGYPSTGPIGLGSLVRISAVGHEPRPLSALPQLGPDRLPVSLLVRQRNRAEATTPPEANVVWTVTAMPAGAPTHVPGATAPVPAPPGEIGGVALERRP